MRVSSAQEPASAASTVRRAQIVAATIEVIAEDGLAQATFARIRQRAGLSSTRLISYHFAGKDDLIAAVVQDVLDRIARHVGQRIEAAESAAGAGNATAILRAYIEGNISFIATHRAPMQALLQVVLASAGLPATTGAKAVAAPGPQASQGPLEGLLRHGQVTGEFRSFDATAVGSAIQRAIEGLPYLLTAQPDLDCDQYASELVELYLRGIRAEQR
jgi:AcrR family transcriptional regulator